MIEQRTWEINTMYQDEENDGEKEESYTQKKVGKREKENSKIITKKLPSITIKEKRANKQTKN